jgi:hypothetical protein
VDKILNILIAINDMDSELKIYQNPYYKELGFKIDEKKIEKLKKLREKEIAKLPPSIKDQYEMLMERYGKGIAPCVEGTCTNCFSVLPTAMISETKPGELIRCPNCSIFLYKG